MNFLKKKKKQRGKIGKTKKTEGTSSILSAIAGSYGIRFSLCCCSGSFDVHPWPMFELLHSRGFVWQCQTISIVCAAVCMCGLVSDVCGSCQLHSTKSSTLVPRPRILKPRHGVDRIQWCWVFVVSSRWPCSMSKLNCWKFDDVSSKSFCTIHYVTCGVFSSSKTSRMFSFPTVGTTASPHDVDPRDILRNTKSTSVFC